jgi:hypothetical protein
MTEHPRYQENSPLTDALPINHHDAIDLGHFASFSARFIAIRASLILPDG